MMTKEFRENVALFRYGIISPLITGTHIYKSRKEGFRQLAQIGYHHPITNEKVTVSATSIERWFYNYKKSGLDGLKPIPRNDRGSVRKIDEELCGVIQHYVNNHPRMTAKGIYEELIRNHYIRIDEISYSCIARFVKKLKSNSDFSNVKVLKRYEAEHVNDIWACDTTYSFVLNVNGEKKRMYIIGIIDDKSRTVVCAKTFFEDNYVNFMSVLKTAVKKYGKPKILNLDNGAPYKNKQIQILAANLGTSLHYCAPYSGHQKGKIERWWRTMKDHFMAEYNINSKTTIEEFNAELQKYVLNYNNSVHSQTKKTPHNIFYDEANGLTFLDDDKIEKIFLLETERRVSIDGVVMINNLEYEVPAKYAKKNIKLRYSNDLSTVYIVNPDNSLESIKLLDKVANSKVKRPKPIFNLEAKQ